MEQYSIWEGFMDELEKKVATIQRKCNKFGCDFHFAKIGEEMKEVIDHTTLDPLTKNPVLVNCKFIICEVEGTAIVNGWEFVASVEHTSKGNIFKKALSDVEIPERYRNSDPYCEHCNSNRRRKDTFIVMNRETGEFKQVGKSCLNDFTHGMSASFAAYLASLKSIFEEIEEKPIGGGFWGYGKSFYETNEFLNFTAETIRHYGYATSDSSESTKDRVKMFFDVTHGRTKYWDPEDVMKAINRMKLVGFNPKSEEAKRMTDDALAWLAQQEETNDYMHNLKVVTSLEFTNESRFGLLVSLFPTWNRDLEIQARKKAEAENGKASEFVGNIGDRIDVEIESVKCLTSWESCFDGYHHTTTYIWKIVGKDENVYIWKTSAFIDCDKPPVRIKGTVKEHKVYRDVKQTVLTRCKMEYK